MTEQKPAATIRITFKDGRVRQWPTQAEIDAGLEHGYRVRYEPGFVVLWNYDHTRLSFASDTIAEIEHTEGGTGF